ncbi:DUF362 domain-containing protein [Parasporobacterium paucivorans]|uniref:Uncharacterized conserved protein, DUF362 family n=1 Tax=Parasporobacterium paucivorans DSM 15970 TaxID=1122934 RepID=A0A1M6D431_9FIRM|nr:DUF362 domain-containing protein [Parasporobacterium paucivorans]SHI67748.1 Uncharacterized conserved protein, DUF362 family [Parasporobacterium paucivorans DSM 15970]
MRKSKGADMEKVSVVECNSYITEEVCSAVAEAVYRLDFTIPRNSTVLIKPNIMSQNTPRQGTITHFSLIEGLCRILQEHGCTIIIGESISFYQKGMTRKAFKTSEIDKVAEKYGAKCIAFEEEPLVKVDTGLTWMKELYLPEILLKADMVINVCKLKSHGSLRLSGAVKNMFGCLPGGYKQKIHTWSRNELELADVFLDINEIVKPALSIMDAIDSLDGGPSSLGKLVDTCRILASTNAAALDVVATEMIDYKNEESPILVQALKRGMIKSFDDIEVLGEPKKVLFKKPVKANLEKPINKNSALIKHTYVDLEINQEKCTGCKKCVHACPVGAIATEGDKVKLDQEKCISCYYCLHVCPVNAILIKPTMMNRLIRFGRFLSGL